MRIRQFSREDLATVLLIQKSTPQSAQWREGDYTALAEQPRGMILVAELETMSPPIVVGFAAFEMVLDEAELRNLAVHPAHQQRGLGRALLVEAHSRLLIAGARQLRLEIRTSNKPALKLYYSLGFQLQNLRKDYYHDPTEDAYVLSLTLRRRTVENPPGG